MRYVPSAALALGILLAVSSACSRNNPPESAAKPAGNMSELDKNSGEPLERVLQVKDPSLYVTRAPDGSIAVSIRGASSFYSNTQPLFVIDGTPISPGPGGTLVGVNPHDIESIKVLKNPEDIGVYGMRGANGVIVVTTKRPGKP